MAAKGLCLLLLLCAALVALAPAKAAEERNITAVLAAFPDYSLYNGYLTQTKVTDEINPRETVTCLVLNNLEMAALAAKHSLAGVKNALRLLSLLDYFDAPKLRDLPNGTAVAHTLLPTTSVNVTTLRRGLAAFTPVPLGAEAEALFTKSVLAMPYNLSVVEISAPITFPGLFDAAHVNPSNLTRVLEDAGCKKFASLLKSSGVLMMYLPAMDKGLTVLAPTDKAFTAPGVPRAASLSSAAIVSLLQYHALPQYMPEASLKDTKGPVSTLASGDAGGYELSVIVRGGSVTLDTGVDISSVASTAVDDTPVCVLTVDKVLLPVELFGKAAAQAPAAEEMSPSSSPGPAVPAPEIPPPPAPPSHNPDDSPTEAPDGSQDGEESDKAGAASLKSFGTVAAIFSVAVALVCSL